jgi:hypothetical protein
VSFLLIYEREFENIEIGSYPFFRLGKVGVSIVLRSTELEQINGCAKQIQSQLELINNEHKHEHQNENGQTEKKKIEVVCS